MKLSLCLSFTAVFTLLFFYANSRDQIVVDRTIKTTGIKKIALDERRNIIWAIQWNTRSVTGISLLNYAVVRKYSLKFCPLEMFIDPEKDAILYFGYMQPEIGFLDLESGIQTTMKLSAGKYYPVAISDSAGNLAIVYKSGHPTGRDYEFAFPPYLPIQRKYFLWKVQLCNKMHPRRKILEIGREELFHEEFFGIWKSVFDPEYNFLAVLSGENEKIYKVDLAENKIIELSDTGKRPVDMCLNSQSDKIFIANSLSPFINVLDVKQGAYVQKLSCPAGIVSIIMNHGKGELYLLKRDGSCLYAFDPETGKILKTMPLGLVPSHMLLTPDGRRLYVSHEGEDSILEIDTAKFCVEKIIKIN